MSTLTVIHGTAIAREHAFTHCGAEVRIARLSPRMADYVLNRLNEGATVAVGIPGNDFQETVERVVEILGAEAALGASYLTRSA